MAVTRQQVAELYVATFNRAPDAAGLDYWVNDSGLTIEQIAQSFFDQPETQTLYPTGTTNSAFVTSIYTNLFNRTPDAAGLAYWEGELANGHMTRSVMIEAMKNGAIGTDADIIANKTTVGLAYAAAGLEGTTFSLAAVTASAATVTTALSDIADLSAPNTSVALTANADIVNGTAGNDTITGTSATYNSGDLIIDSSTTDADVLTITATDDIAATATVAGIETVNFNLNAFSTTGDTVFDIAATNIAATTMNIDVTKVGTSVASAQVTAMKSGLTVNGSTNLTTALTATLAGTAATTDTEVVTVTGKAAAITANSTAGNLTAATITSTSATTATLTTDSVGTATLTTTVADMVIDAQTATTVVATSAVGIDAATNNLTAATSVTLTALDDVDVDLTAAASATISAGTVATGAVSTITDTVGTVLTTLNLSGNGSVATFNTTGADDVKTINISGSQNVTVVMSAADIDTLAAGDNKLTVVDSSTGTSTITVGTAAGDMDLSAAAVDAINLAIDNATKTATFATGAALTVSVDQTGGTLDGVTSSAATNALTVNLNDGTLSTTPTAGADLTGVTITDFANVTINASTDDIKSTISGLTASANNTNVTVNAGALGLTVAGTSTLGTGALTLNSTAAIAMGASVLTAASLTTVGAGAVTWTALDASKIATVTTGSGADALTISSTNGNLSVNSGAGNDTIIVGAATATKTLTINGGDGALDTLNITAAVDMTLGTSLTLTGIERLDFDGAATINNSVISGQSYIISDVTTGGTVAVTVSLGTGTTSDLSTLVIDTATVGTGDSFIITAAAATSGVTLTGAAITNTFTGSGYADTITGGAGADTIAAGAGNDTVNGAAGADFLYGAAGDDSITAGEGIDAIAGGAGADTIILTETTAAVDYITYLALSDGSVAGAAAGTFTGYDVVTGFATTSDKIVFDAAAAITASVVVTTPVVTGAVTVVAATAATNALNDMTTSNFTSADQAVNYFNDLIASGAYTVSAASAPDVIAVTFGASTALYTITSADSVVAATEIKLLGTYDAVLVSGDIIIA